MAPVKPNPVTPLAAAAAQPVAPTLKADPAVVPVQPVPAAVQAVPPTLKADPAGAALVAANLAQQ